MLFLTEIDPRAAVKESRDPLGLVPLRGAFRRKVVGNLTTVTNSVRGFTKLLLGYYFAQEVAENGDHEAESTLSLFLKFEQLAAYCQYHVNRDRNYRGIESIGPRRTAIFLYRRPDAETQADAVGFLRRLLTECGPAESGDQIASAREP